MRKIAPENPLLLAARNGRLNAKLNNYLNECRAPPDEECNHGKRKNAEDRIPNLAGFCRSVGCGLSAFDELLYEFPHLADYLCAVFEDEALNAIRSPAFWNAHFKERFGVHSEVPDNAAPVLVFEHDIEEDGA